MIGAYHPEVSGGAAQCRTLVRALSGRVRFVIMATTHEPQNLCMDRVDGVPVERVLIRLKRPWEKLAALPRMLRIFARYRSATDIVHLHGLSQKILLFLILAKACRKPTLILLTSAGADDPLTLRGRFDGWIWCRALAFADRVVSLSPALTARYLAAGMPTERLAVIPNGVDTGRFRPPRDPGEVRSLRLKLGLPEDRPVLTYVGHFSREKGSGTLLEAWKQVRAEGHRSTLLLIGATVPGHYEVDPSLVCWIRGEVRRLGAEDEVRFVERTPEIEQYLRASDLFVLSSLREGLPNALLEAMATGLPCLASRLPGITDWVIDNGVNGLLFTPGEKEELAKGLRELLADPRLRKELGRAARWTIEERFPIEHVAEQYLALYREVLGARG